jgi:hypothetical protein
MKHLRRFNESVNKEEELQDFCETYLAYLLDDGFEVSIQHMYSNQMTNKHDYHFVTIKKSGKVSNNFKWEEIKDQFIPFISVLSKQYKLGAITFYGTKYYTYRDPFTQLGMDDRKYGKEPVSKLYYTKNIITDYINFKFPMEFITIVVQ